MAERRDGDLRIQPRRGHASRYDWASWTDGGIWRLRQGEDFDVEHFRRTMLRATPRRSLART